MRGSVPGLRSRLPLLGRLPAVYQEDPFVQQLVPAFDDVLAPALLTLDGLHAYLDPWLAPEDFLAWLAQWVGVQTDDTAPVSRRRASVAGAALVHRRRGTPAGVRDAVRLALGLGPASDGVDPDAVVVQDGGGTAWSRTPRGVLPGSDDPYLVVRVTVPDPAAVDVARLDRVITSVKPAHVPHRLVVGGHPHPAATEEPC